MWDFQVTLCKCISCIMWKFPVISICVQRKPLLITLLRNTKHSIYWEGSSFPDTTLPLSYFQSHLWASNVLSVSSPSGLSCPPLVKSPSDNPSEWSDRPTSPAWTVTWGPPPTPHHSTDPTHANSAHQGLEAGPLIHLPLAHSTHTHLGPGYFWTGMGLTHLHIPPGQHSTVHSKSWPNCIWFK